MEYKSLTTPAAIGGTETTTATHRIHTFTSSGMFTVNKSMNVECLVVAGGGAGGSYSGGGGGAGGYQYNPSFAVTSQSYSITVGDGGIATFNDKGTNGSNSVFDTITAIGGGAGGAVPDSKRAGENGGSGGGGAVYAASGGIGSQGYDGGSSKTYYATLPYQAGGGGGGAGGTGASVGSGNYGGSGGVGLLNPITNVYYAGGGGGGCQNTLAGGGAGGLGGGGNGSWAAPGIAGTANTGGGGGGGGNNNAVGQLGGNGGSGIVIIRYPLSEDLTPTGSLRITSTPSGAGIYLAPHGQTPSWQNTYTPDPIIGLAPGYYDIRLTRSGYEDWTFGNAEIIANTETQISASMVLVNPANITATNMTVTPSETPCRQGTCTVTIVVRWSNSGGTNGTVIPNITIDDVPQTAHASRNVLAGSYIDETFIISNLSVGTHTICPDPN